MPTLQEAFDILKMNRSNLFFAGEEELLRQEDLKRMESVIINSSDPKELGSNEAARNAKIRDLSQEERKKLDAASKKKREAQLAYDLATMSVDLLKWEIRQLESEKQ